MASKLMRLSSKYADIISASDLLSSGTPVVYQLKPKIKNIGTLSRITIGEKTPGRTNKTILLVGETGSGKSTMINALVNYAMGVKWEDEIWFEIVKEGQRIQAYSQTSDVVVYEIFGFEGEAVNFSLTIIDTPGYGDMRGKTHDAKVRQRLLDLFRSRDGVHEVDAVGLVLKATQNRPTVRLKYIFDSVMSLFGKDIEKNIVAIMTHSDGLPPENAMKALLTAKIKCAKNEKNMPVNFLFNNHQRDPRDEDTETALENAWRLTTKGMQRFSKFLEEIQPQKLKTTIEVLNSRIQLTAAIHNLQERIKSADETQRAIRQTQSELERNRDSLERNKNFTVEVLEEYTDLEPYGNGWDFLHVRFDGVTRCQRCEQNCHYPGCATARNASLCEVLADGRCTRCPGRCSVSDHIKDTQKYVNKTRKVKKTLQEIQDSCLDRSKVVDSSGLTQAEQKKKNLEEQVFNLSSVLADLEKKVETLEADKTKWIEEAYQHVLKLEETPLTMKTTSTQVDLGVLIETMKERNETVRIQVLEKMISEMDVGSKEVLSDAYDHLLETTTHHPEAQTCRTTEPRASKSSPELPRPNFKA
ncbi:uncharacterized protein V6R79_026312 [Siganus canaliculatus]